MKLNYGLNTLKSHWKKNLNFKGIFPCLYSKNSSLDSMKISLFQRNNFF